MKEIEENRTTAIVRLRESNVCHKRLDKLTQKEAD